MASTVAIRTVAPLCHKGTFCTRYYRKAYPCTYYNFNLSGGDDKRNNNIFVGGTSKTVNFSQSNASFRRKAEACGWGRWHAATLTPSQVQQMRSVLEEEHVDVSRAKLRGWTAVEGAVEFRTKTPENMPSGRESGGQRFSVGAL